MTHLRKGVTGHLMKNAAGHLVKCAPVVNTCNTCDPPIPDMLYVTFSGLSGGDFSTFNGKHGLPWLSECQWQLDLEFPPVHRISVWYQPTETDSWCNTTPRWVAAIHGRVGRFCGKGWCGPTGICDPTGDYVDTDANCGETGCLYGGSCAGSAGATCVVSLT